MSNQVIGYIPAPESGAAGDLIEVLPTFGIPIYQDLDFARAKAAEVGASGKFIKATFEMVEDA